MPLSVIDERSELITHSGIGPLMRLWAMSRVRRTGRQVLALVDEMPARGRSPSSKLPEIERVCSAVKTQSPSPPLDSPSSAVPGGAAYESEPWRLFWARSSPTIAQVASVPNSGLQYCSPSVPARSMPFAKVVGAATACSERLVPAAVPSFATPASSGDRSPSRIELARLIASTRLPVSACTHWGPGAAP